MKVSELRIIHRVIKHIKRKFPEVELKIQLETKFFYYISVNDPYIMIDKEFSKRRDLVRKLHGRKLKKKTLFITQGQFIKKAL